MQEVNSPCPTYWIFPANTNKFDIHKYINSHNGVIYWRQDGCKPHVGDLVYLYLAKPEQSIRYYLKIIEVDLPPSDSIINEVKPFRVDDLNFGRKYCRLKLLSKINNQYLTNAYFQKHGYTNATNQINRKWNLSNKPEFFEYITTNHIHLDSFFDANEVLEADSMGKPEGALDRILVNRYERNPFNRRACIEEYGAKCQVCGFDFEKIYGEIGQGFIHVHHIVPLSTINESYIINPRTDLIPVCPNCHAMLHKKINGILVDIKMLKEILNRNN